MYKRNEDSRRVKNPADSVVNSFGLGERLVTALVSDNPKTSGYKTGGKAVEGPQSELGEGVEVG